MVSPWSPWLNIQLHPPRTTLHGAIIVSFPFTSFEGEYSLPCLEIGTTRAPHGSKLFMLCHTSLCRIAFFTTTTATAPAPAATTTTTTTTATAAAAAVTTFTITLLLLVHCCCYYYYYYYHYLTTTTASAIPTSTTTVTTTTITSGSLVVQTGKHISYVIQQPYNLTAGACAIICTS